MNFDLDKVKGTCRALSKVRASLCGYEDLSGDSLMKIAQHRAKSFIHDKGFLNKELWDIKRIPKETNFLHACQIVLTNLEQIKGNYFKRECLDSLVDQLHQKEVLISFYGDTSVGKSTLLNSIMEDRYLPVQQDAETAINVKVFFKQVFTGQDSYQEQPVDKLCDSGIVVAGGVEEIRNTLQKYNKKSRHNQCDVGVVELHLNKHFGQDIQQNPRIVLQDNPGCDENGSKAILSHVEKAKTSSTAFIFITTFQQFRTMVCSNALKSIFLKNKDIVPKQPSTSKIEPKATVIIPYLRHLSEGIRIILSEANIRSCVKPHHTLGEALVHPKDPLTPSLKNDIIKEKRLAVVINKMDEIFSRRPGEANYERQQVIDEVHHFLCENVFGCVDSKLTKDYIFLVCGTWAYYGRMHEKYCEEFDYGVEMEMLKIKHMTEFSPVVKRKVDGETPTCKKALCLVELSNITKLESRLHSMAESSFRLWKCKMNSDIGNIMKEIITSLMEEIAREEKSAEENVRRIEPYHEVMVSIKQLFKKVLKEKKNCKKILPKSLYIAKLFKEACEEDFDKKENFSTCVDQCTDEAIELFKSATERKMRRGNYSAEKLINDLISLMNDISKKINMHLTSWNVMSKLVDAYSIQSVQMWKTTVTLRESLSKVLNTHYCDMEKENQISYPKLAGPDLQVSLDLPLRLPFKKKIWIFLQQFFTRRKIKIPTQLSIIFNEDPEVTDEAQKIASVSNSDGVRGIVQNISTMITHNDSASSLQSSHQDDTQDSDANSDSCSSLDDEDDESITSSSEQLPKTISASGDESLLCNANKSLISDIESALTSNVSNEADVTSVDSSDTVTSQNNGGSVSSSSSSQSCRQINPFNQISSPIEAVESSYNIELEDIALSMDEVITAKIDTEEIREESEISLSQPKPSKEIISDNTMVVSVINSQCESSLQPNEGTSEKLMTEETVEASRTNSSLGDEPETPGGRIILTTRDDVDQTNQGQSVIKEETAVENETESGVLDQENIARSNSDLGDLRNVAIRFTSNTTKGETSTSNTTNKQGADKELENTGYIIGLNLLEELTKQLTDHVKESITSFVQEKDRNIVLVYCKTYYEAAVKILKEFDTSAANDLSTAQTFLKTNIRALELQRKSKINLDKNLNAIRTMVEQFGAISMDF